MTKLFFGPRKNEREMLLPFFLLFPTRNVPLPCTLNLTDYCKLEFDHEWNNYLWDIINFSIELQVIKTPSLKYQRVNAQKKVMLFYFIDHKKFLFFFFLLSIPYFLCGSSICNWVSEYISTKTCCALGVPLDSN